MDIYRQTSTLGEETIWRTHTSERKGVKRAQQETEGVRLLGMAVVSDRDEVMASRGRQAAKICLGQKRAAVTDHAITKVVHNVILIKRIIVETKLVKGIDAIELATKEFLLVMIPVVASRPRHDLAIDMDSTTTTNTLAERHEASSPLKRSVGHDTIELLRVRRQELLVWVVCEVFPTNVVLAALGKLGLDTGERGAILAGIVRRRGITVLEVERNTNCGTRISRLPDLLLLMGEIVVLVLDTQIALDQRTFPLWIKVMCSSTKDSLRTFSRRDTISKRLRALSISIRNLRSFSIDV